MTADLPETWKAVKGFEGYLEVSSIGRVRSLPGRRYKTGRPRLGGLLRLQIREGYYKLTYDGKMLLVQRLVAEAFLPNPENKPQVMHWDGNRLNNHLSNLSWATTKEIMVRASELGHKPRGEAVLSSKLTSSKVRAIRASTGINQRTLAANYGVSVTTIQSILYRKTWKHVT